MTILKSVGKYIGYYIIACVLTAMFVAQSFKGAVYALAGATVAVSFLAATLSLLIGDSGGAILKKVSSWCLRGLFIVVAVMSACGIGWTNIVEFFKGV